jgi:TolB protein
MRSVNSPIILFVRWLLCAAAFAAVVGSTGCATQTSLAPPPAIPQDDTQAFSNAAAAQVNVFGEMNGLGRGTSMTVGDQGFVQNTFADEGYDADVAVSPNGKWLAFDSTRDSEHPAIYLQRVDGTSVTKLTSDDSDNAFPTFSPDGKQIAFCSTRSGVWNLYIIDTDGRNAVQITNGQTQCIHPSFSPDGAKLAYCALGSRSDEWELWVVDLGTGEKQQIGYGLFPSFCPAHDGVYRIAFQRARQRGSRWFSLWTLDLVDGEARRVTEVAVSNNAAIVSPNWSPDGKRLVFATILDPNHADKHRHGEQDVWSVAADGSDRRRLTDGNGINLSPVWSVDNRVYFVSDRGGNECVWSVRPPTGPTLTASAQQSNQDPAAPGTAAQKPPAPPQEMGAADTDDAEK